MKLLLDTHTFLWWNGGTPQLSPKVTALIQDPSNERILSVGSVWEMQIKSATGKLKLPTSLQGLLAAQPPGAFRVLPIALDHVLLLDNLPHHHKDPFDRILIAQAISEGATLASKDTVFSRYPLTVVW